MYPQKTYLKIRPACRVTFRLPRAAAGEAVKVAIVGDFNQWDRQAHNMKKLKNGDFSITVELKPERSYQYRYLIDGSRWENDWNADTYTRSPYGDCDNSVVVV